MNRLSEKQLNNLSKDTLIVLLSSMQDQLASLQEQLDAANAET